MGLKTFNLDEETYKRYSSHCRENGISMSKRVENFIKQELEVIDKSSSRVMAKEIFSNKNIDKHSMEKYC